VLSVEEALRLYLQASSTDEPVHLSSAELRGTEQKVLAERVAAAYLHPLVVKGVHLGALMLLRLAPQAGFTGPELQRAKIFGVQVAVAVESAFLYEQLRAKAITDELTGLFSRSYLFETLRQLIMRMVRKQQPALSCLMADVDHFKRINDSYGHMEGDRLLREIAATIRRSVRGSDVVARFGGEEFCVLLPDTATEGALIVAEKIRGAVEEQRLHDVTLSVGVASQQRPNEEPAKEGTGPGCDGPALSELMTSLLRRADEALYAAKARGRNRVVLAEPLPQTEAAGTTSA
jgi:diguanylate cyclase (GGDEF)-like protein